MWCGRVRPWSHPSPIPLVLLLSFLTSNRSLIGLCRTKCLWPTSWLIPPGEAVDFAVADVSAMASVLVCLGKKEEGALI